MCCTQCGWDHREVYPLQVIILGAFLGVKGGFNNVETATIEQALVELNVGTHPYQSDNRKAEKDNYYLRNGDNKVKRTADRDTQQDGQFSGET